MGRLFRLLRPHSSIVFANLALMAVSQLARLLIPFSSRYLLDSVAPAHSTKLLILLLLALCMAVVVDALALSTAQQRVNALVGHLIRDLRRQLFNHTLKMPLCVLDGMSTGELVTRILDDPDGISAIAGPAVFSAVLSLISGAIVFGLLLAKSWRIGACIFIAMFLGAILIQHLIKQIGSASKPLAQLQAAAHSQVTEALLGLRLIRTCSGEGDQGRDFEWATQKIFRQHQILSLREKDLSIASIAICGSASILFIGFGGVFLIHSRWTPGEFVQFLATSMYLVAPVFTISNLGPTITRGVVALKQLEKILNIEEEAAIGTCPAPIAGEVQFHNVCFEYSRDRRALSMLSFSVPAGSTCAIVGGSGSGKSTILALLCGLYRPSLGMITMDGIDIREISCLPEYRKQLGILLQEAALFSGTIKSNILMAKPDSTDLLLREACGEAFIFEFADYFPGGLDTPVGERGILLSGGQRRRIGLARVILSNPRVLLLDEPTSGLDAFSERVVRNGLRKAGKGKTTIYVTHSIADAREADQIIVLEGGSLAESGSHLELLANAGPYFRMFSEQTSRYVESRAILNDRN
ncbi:ABC-type multidrug transport system fused ATPase/permease subunit [Granulicella aggregans]|uniref:ABC-type multidrug transport system fused ATPase/permease subunit n=1 Tax=Granulicella aggregans TaxID=474949 RepID=A0A7W7ZCI5_9BACT|nr:ABC transporter ATP-binding protein [Granulicella aggregans]MBB5057400.1 ABC-type multidrug transport system fused ATPase/permease subunit [Granulicella aggregans]